MKTWKVQAFYDAPTFTLTYVVWDSLSRDAVVIDSVWDYDPAASKLSSHSLDTLRAFLLEQKLKVHFLLETHAHADHVTGAQPLRNWFPGAIVGIGRRITEVQQVFRQIFDLPESFATDGRQFDRLFEDKESVVAGSLQFSVLFTPGHTPACCSYLFGDMVFTGDALFMPDYGVGRCDFPAGSAPDLFRSVTQRLYSLPDSTRVFTGHDYLPNGRAMQYESTIGEQKRANIHLPSGRSEADFVRFRTERDKTLAAPRLLLPSVQLNIDAGHLPPAHANGKRYLTIPLGV